ncbi:MAG: translation initiation factor IF-2 [Pirellulales bacterium]
MPTRIYTLAKELKLDSKDLVDICAEAGVTGKGSALASLSDEEIAQVKQHLSGGSKGGGASGAPAAATTEAAPRSTAVEAGPKVMRREDYIAPTGMSGKLNEPTTPPRESKLRRGGDSPRPVNKPASKPTTSIRLAAMPDAPTPPPTEKSDEPAPQKPDLKLPADVLRASKAGAKPLEAHLRKRANERPAASVPEERGKPSSDGGGAKERGRRSRGPSMIDDADSKSDAAMGSREQRQAKRRRSGATRRRRSETMESGPATARQTPFRRRKTMRRLGTNTAAPRKSSVVIDLPCTVRSFSEAVGVSAGQVLGKLLQLGTMTNINAEIDEELAALLADELGADVTFKQPVNLEDEMLASFEDEADSPESLEPRPPIVTFLGHVDHGKTSLLDRIIGIDVVTGESGGITQHIRAYRVDREEGAVTFVDTPGHEAFTEMRARGANVTDIAVLVVAADDGVMPQTEEAISHARAAGVPIVVALNKVDLPGVDINRVMQELASNELLPSAWGGDVEVVQTSAIAGTGIDELLDTLMTVSELHEYKANPSRAASGTCLEAELHEGRGVVTKLLVQTGTLNVGDILVCGGSYGRVKAMYDTLDLRKTHESVGPSTPVNVTGLDVAPGAGERFHVIDDISKAREIAESRAEMSREEALGGQQTHVTLESLFDRLGEKNEVQTLNLILRADVRGSIEAIRKELTKLEHPEVQIKILQATVGGVSEADVHLADASDAIIIGFNVVPDEKARALADRRGVQIRRYDIIYQITDDLKAALEGMLKPEEHEKDLGRALVLRLFPISRVGVVVGCRVLAGTIQRNCHMRVIRDNRVIGDYPLESLRREKDDTREVREGFECGIKLSGFNDLKEGDVLEAYKIEEVARTL